MSSSRLKIIGCMFVLFISIEAMPQAPLFPVQVKGLWGYIDQKGAIVIEPRYRYARMFSEGLAAVFIAAGRCGYITGDGSVATNAKFVNCGDYSEGLAAVEMEGKYGYLDKQGEIVIAPRWTNASRFSQGMARVGEGSFDSVRYGFIDHKGTVVIKPELPYAGDFHNDRALAAIDGKIGLKVGYVGLDGKWKIKPRFGSATDFSEGYACVTDEGSSSVFESDLLLDPNGPVYRAHYIDKNGKRAFRGNFSGCGAFSEGLAAVKTNDTWHFIDRFGVRKNIATFPSSYVVGIFSEGMATVNMGSGAKFIDKNGRTVIQTTFDWADNFLMGIARVKLVQKNGTILHGYIDSAGKVIWAPSE
jgi:hypothetical protein